MRRNPSMYLRPILTFMALRAKNFLDCTPASNRKPLIGKRTFLLISDSFSLVQTTVNLCKELENQ